MSSCGISNPFDDNIAYKTRFDDGLAFFEEENYVKASQQFNIIVDRASHTDLTLTLSLTKSKNTLSLSIFVRDRDYQHSLDFDMAVW